MRPTILALALLTAVCSQAQVPGRSISDPVSDPKLTELVREAVASVFDQSSEAHRFTFFELAHTQNRDHNGKLFYDRTVLSETTYINELPYDRVLEVNGKPLNGAALVAEQTRYDQAIKDRTAMDAAARAAIEKSRFINAALPYSQLTTRFHLTDLRQEIVETSTGGMNAHVIDAVPIPSQNPLLPSETRHLLLWIASTSAGFPPHLLRADYDYIAPAQTPEGVIQPGSHGRITYTLIDAVAVPEHKEIHTQLIVGKPGKTEGFKPMQVDVERTYSYYRQFATGIRIVPNDAAAPATPRQ